MMIVHACLAPEHDRRLPPRQSPGAGAGRRDQCAQAPGRGGRVLERTYSFSTARTGTHPRLMGASATAPRAGDRRGAPTRDRGALWGDYASLGWYQIGDTALLLGRRYPGYAVTR